MNFPFFASFILFCIWLTFTLIRSRKNSERANDNFWEREALANQTRKKSLEDLEYIIIPYDTLPFSLLLQDPEIAECHQILRSFENKKAVNLTGYSNTDLKIQYGAPNITLLTEYDQNYTILVRTLQRWADLLIKAGHREDVVPILEFAVSTRTDISATYRILASIYHDKQEVAKIEQLKQTAEELHSAMRPAILRSLDEFLT